MNVPRVALLVLVAIAMPVASAAEQGRLLVGQARNSSFRLTLPEGWRVTSSPDPSANPPANASRHYVFELFRASTGVSPLWIEGLLYADTVPIRERSEASSVSEMPRVGSASVWTLFELESAATVTACTQLVKDVLCIKLRVPDGTLAVQARSDLYSMLNSFTEVPKLP
jgi:hypothetical protein